MLMIRHFFVSNLDSASEILKVFDTFSIYSGLKKNIKKMQNSRYWKSERGKGGTLRGKLNRSCAGNDQNPRSSFLLQ